MLRRTAMQGVAMLMAAMAVAGAAQAADAPDGHDVMLRQLIADATQGKLQYQSMTRDLAAAVRPQATLAQAELVALGALRSVTFVTVDRSGAELYRTIFERGALEWAFAVDANGLISNAAFRPLSSGL